MPEEQLFKTDKQVRRPDIARLLRDVADQLDSGEVTLESDAETRRVTVPESPRPAVELERLTDSETGDQRYELEHEIRWTR